MWNNSYRTPTECWKKTSDFPKGKKLPTDLGRAKEKRKTRDKRIGTGPAPLEGAVKEERFPPTRKPLHWWRRGVGRGKLQSHRGEHSKRGAEGKVERFLHRRSLPTTTHQPEACLFTYWREQGLGAEARALEVRSQGEDWGWLREHSLRGLVHHS